MKVLITGATGLVGRALTLRLRRDGHEVVALVRRKSPLLGPDIRQIEQLDLTAIDAVVNLAGESIIGRWTKQKRERLVSSRVGLTQQLVDDIGRCKVKPKVLLSASAVGFYGDTADRVVDETSPAGDDFLAKLCAAWESAAMRASEHGVRTAVFRFGIVLAGDGGALAKQLPIFRAGLGGRIGSGEQYVSFIHLDDLIELLATALTDSRYQGAVNAVAPHPATNKAFTQELASALRRPAVFPVPALALKAVFGEAASVMLGSQRVLPRVAERLGFEFRYPELADAFAQIAGDKNIAIRRIEPVRGEHPYLRRRQPSYELHTRTVLDAPLEAVFEFFCRPENLAVITPERMHFEITQLPKQLEAGAHIQYKLRALGAPIRWRTLIAEWQMNDHFVDAQEQGPYHAWWHEHRFIRVGDQTIMEDRVRYAPPLGVLGRLVHGALIAPELRSIFAHRNDIIRRRFGEANMERISDHKQAV